MNSRTDISARGYSLIELLVAIGIIGLILTLVTISISFARKDSRDQVRISELSQIQLALRMYKEVHNEYPPEWGENGLKEAGGPGQVCYNDSDDYSGCNIDGISAPRGVGTICPDCTGPINDVLRKYMGDVPGDPIHSKDHFYYYDGAHNCFQSGSQAVLIAVGMENPEDNTNYDEIFATCDDGDGVTEDVDLGTESRGNREDVYYILLGSASI